MRTVTTERLVPIDNQRTPQQMKSDYDYSQPGMLTLVHRRPDNLIGQSLLEATKHTAEVNLELMREQNS